MHNFKHSYSPDVDKLWIIAVISNPVRYKSRYALYEQFKKQIEIAGANLLTVELALGQRPFEITKPENKYDIQLRTNDEVWHKENLINIGISRLPADWKYVAWIDADIGFIRPDWVEEIPHQLQHYQVIQLFQNAIDLGPTGEVHKTYDGFMASWLSGKPLPYSDSYYPTHWHSGFAWAARREAIDHLGGLIDTAILGAADHHMAWALIGKVKENTPKSVSEGYLKHLLLWEDRATKHIKQNVGYMSGSIYHNFHGKKSDRKYIERWQILLNHKFDPYLDLKKDWQGLYQFTSSGEKLRNDIRAYFRSRNEDSIDL